jgi:hypothetical protein
MRYGRRLICGLDITPSALRLVVAERRWRTAHVRTLVVEPREADASVATQLAAIARTHRLRWHELHVALAAADATHRILTLPFGGTAHLDAAVPSALRALVPFPLQDGVVAYEPVRVDSSQGTTVCAALTDPAALARLTGDLGAGGFDITSVRYAPLAAASLVGPLLAREECAAFLDLAAPAATLTLFRHGELSALRLLAWRPTDGDPLPGTADCDRLADEIRWSLTLCGAEARTPLVVAGGPDTLAAGLADELRHALRNPVGIFHEIEIPELPDGWRTVQGQFAVALGVAVGAMRYGGAGRGFPVPGPPSKRRGGAAHAELRRTRALATAALALLLVHAATGYLITRRRLANVERALGEHLEAVSDDEYRAGSVADLEDRVNALARRLSERTFSRIGGLEILYEVSRRAAGTLDVVVDEVVFDGTNARLMGHAGDFEVVDALKQALAASDIFGRVETTEAASVGTAVEFQLLLELRNAGARSS